MEKIKNIIIKLKLRFLILIDPKLVPNKVYRNFFGKDINWKEPKDLIEKIYWLQLYSNTSLWTLCADKYAVRDFLKERECSSILNDLYGKWDRADDIDWDLLPQEFVLKTNNSCGQIILVNDKNQLNKKEAIDKLNAWMKYKYGSYDGQYHYSKIKPCIIAEKLLINDKNVNESLIDYKIWCFNGEPECILVASNRKSGEYELSMYDLEWNNISTESLNNDSPHFSGKEIAKPESLEIMIDCARKLSSGFPQVRVDFYEINNKPIFGEMTFSTGFGSYNKNFYNALGHKVFLDKDKKYMRCNRPMF